MTAAKEKKDNNGAGALVNATVGLGAAATKFAMDQVETAFCAVASPSRAMDRVKRSIDNFAGAMNAPLEEAREAFKDVTTKAAEAVRETVQETEEEVKKTSTAFTGRKT